jgi:hypothetical protein
MLTYLISVTKSCSILQARIQEFLVGDDMDEEKIGRGLRAVR